MNDHAFPAPEYLIDQEVDQKKIIRLTMTRGMTLRDYFAAKAMQAYISKIPLHDSEGILGVKTERSENTKLQKDIAESAYWMADSMLEERLNQKEAK